MPVQPFRPDSLRGRVFRGSAVVRDGRLTAGQLRSPAWRRLFRDVYACATVEVTHQLRAVAAARLLLPGAVVSGRSAAVLWGVETAAAAADDVELTVPPGSSASTVPGVRVRRWLLSPDDVRHHDRTPATSPVRTAVDVGREDGPVEESVAVVDALVAAGRADLERIRQAAAVATGPRCRRARRVVGLADGLAGSAQETRLRLLLHASRLPRPVAQFVVRDPDGQFVARVDFAWPEHRLALEYEGAWHGRPQQVAKDRARLNRLTACGWRVVFVTAADLHDPVRLVARIAAALAG
jgi:very-short-patch-repair endonuclease